MAARGLIPALMAAVLLVGCGGSAPPAAPPAAPADAPAVLADLRGSGAGRSEKFTVASDWHIDWSFDCVDHTRVFQIYVQADTVMDVAANVADTKGSGRQPEYVHGTFYLDIIGGCNWHVVASS